MMSSTTSSSHSRPGSRNNPGGEESSSTTRFASAVADGHGDGGAGTTTSVVSAASAVPVERLVSHLLAARQALSDTMGPVLQANALTTEARAAQEEAVVLGAQTAFLRRGIAEEVLMLQRLRRSMGHAYEAGRREFRHVLRTLDAADARLERTIGMLRSAIVEPAFRPEGEGPRSLLDFVEEKSIDRLRDALKESITDLQVRYMRRLGRIS